jgi:hypothetical protein
MQHRKGKQGVAQCAHIHPPPPHLPLFLLSFSRCEKTDPWPIAGKNMPHNSNPPPCLPRQSTKVGCGHVMPCHAIPSIHPSSQPAASLPPHPASNGEAAAAAGGLLAARLRGTCPSVMHAHIHSSHTQPPDGRQRQRVAASTKQPAAVALAHALHTCMPILYSVKPCLRQTTVA